MKKSDFYKRLLAAAAALALCAGLLSGCSLEELGALGDLLGGSTGQTENATDQEKLYAILDDIAANMHPGTAGSSLTAIRLVMQLVNWARTTKLSASETSAAVKTWLQQHPELQAAFKEQLSSIADAWGLALQDGAADLLESAGVEGDLSNLGSRLQQLIREILATGGVNG